MKNKKVFRRLCLTNWGGVDHTILEFNEYVNLFSGKSGSGKSTVLDALQVLLYGSVSSNFLNRAADDNKNKRSVFGYLRGEQKDGTANRADQDFCSVIALEIEDVGRKSSNCIGMAFEVAEKDHELKKLMYFSHSGKMPKQGYLTKEGIPFTHAQIRKFVKTREDSDENRGPGDVNRIYPTKDAYLRNLYETILGAIDGNRFVTMEKSAISLRMTDGTGQFIKDYMFPKGTGDIVERLSSQLGAYRDICERIEDLKKRIALLTDVKEAGQKLVNAEADKLYCENMQRCLDIEDARDHIQAWSSQKATEQKQMQELQEKIEQLRQQEEENNNALTQAKADLQASDLGRKKEHLEELLRRSEMLATNSRRWRNLVERLKMWGQDDYINDYISQVLLRNIDHFVNGKVTVDGCNALREQIASEKKALEHELSLLQDDLREMGKQRDEKKKLVEDMRSNRKSYREHLRKARTELETHLQYACGKGAKVFILADLFDVMDADWKNAVEGCMGRLRFALVTEPKYAKEAAKQFRKLARYENVDLMNTEALAESNPQAKDNSLYEAVRCEEAYVDACLRRFLGGIIKCETEEEMIAAGNGVTKDCYSYHNFMFRHLRKKDYEISFIGTKVSKAKLGQYEQELEVLNRKVKDLSEQVAHLKTMYEFEMLSEAPEDYVGMSRAGTELEETNIEIEETKKTIFALEHGEHKELQERVEALTMQYKALREQMEQDRKEQMKWERSLGELDSKISAKQEYLDNRLLGYVENEQIKEVVRIEREHNATQVVKRRLDERIKDLEEQAVSAREERSHARDVYINAYPNSNEFTGIEKSNEPYEKKLLEYQQNYEPKYQEEFEKQCKLIYKSLRDNVIAKIHGDIKAAQRHKKDINRLLRETKFSDSRYQIDIEAAQNADGQFYEMLMAEELDTKNLDNGGFEGQMSLGEDEFYRKYEFKIKELMEKFMPVKNADDTQLAKHRQEMEKYVDYRTYLSFRMYEVVTDEEGRTIRKNYVDEMAGKDSGGEGQNPKYVALLAGFAMLYMSQTNRDSKIKLVLLDEAFSKMDQERSAVCLQYARKMELQLIVCVPDERLQSLIRNVDSVYGFRRKNNRISMMHIDKGAYRKMMEGEDGEEGEEA